MEGCAGFDGASPYPDIATALGFDALPAASSLLILTLAGTRARRDLSFCAATRAGTVDEPVMMTSALAKPEAPPPASIDEAEG